MRLLIQTATATGGAAAAALQSHSLQAQYNYSSMREDDIELAIKVVSEQVNPPPPSLSSSLLITLDVPQISYK